MVIFRGKKAVRTVAVPVLVAVLVTVLFLSGQLEKFELISIDLRYHLLPPDGAVPVTLVAIDRNSLKEIGVWPWPRDLYARFIRRLEELGAGCLLVDLDFSSRSRDREGDRQLAEAVAGKMPVFFAMHMEEKENELGFKVLNASLPFAELLEVSAGAASIVFTVDEDSTVRGMPPVIRFGDAEFMPLGYAGARAMDGSAVYDPPEGALINISEGMVRSVPVIPFLDVLAGSYHPEAIRGRAVLLGATSQDLRDFWSSSLGIIPGVYLHAAVMNTVLNRSWVTRSGTAVTVFLLFGLSILQGLIMGRTGWRTGAITMALYLVALVAAAWAALQFRTMLQLIPLTLISTLQYPVHVALHARRTEEVLDMERSRTDALLKMSELEDAEETGQEPYMVPLVLLRQVLGLNEIRLFTLTGDLRDIWMEDAVIGAGRFDHDRALLDEAARRGELITVKGDDGALCVYVPLRTVRRPMGALFVAGTEEFQASESELRVLLSYATQTAYFLESRELAEKMKEEEIVRTNLARYLSPQIVEQIMEEKVQVNLGGHRKTVTALFSDIRRFTSISETMAPDQLVDILNDYFNEMATIIFYHQGSLDKYIGDALIAVYGSLIELDNPVRNCVDSAIAMMGIMPALNRKWSSRHDGFTMEVGIGINTGEVFLGNIGSVERMEFTVIGDAVNVASRLSDLAAPGQILLTESAADRVRDLYDLEELSPVAVKGKTVPMRVFSVRYRTALQNDPLAKDSG